MFVGSTATIALSNMAEVASRSSTGSNLSTAPRTYKQRVSTSRKVDDVTGSAVFVVDAIRPANYHPRALPFDILLKD